MAEKKEPKVTKGNIKNGTIELVLLLLLRSEKKYGYQLANELLEYSEGAAVSKLIRLLLCVRLT